MQVRALAHFDGREPCSYLLDPAVNYVPELPLGGEDSLGRPVLYGTSKKFLQIYGLKSLKDLPTTAASAGKPMGE